VFPLLAVAAKKSRWIPCFCFFYSFFFFSFSLLLREPIAGVTADMEEVSTTTVDMVGGDLAMVGLVEVVEDLADLVEVVVISGAEALGGLGGETLEAEEPEEIGNKYTEGGNE
jgi:hypothetical protein